jgi:carboxymethylenebutenolidase
MAFRPYLIEEIALDCVEGALTRREALRRLALLGVTGTAAAALLAAAPRHAAASSDSTVPTTGGGGGSTDPVAEGAAEVVAEGEEVTFPGPNGDLIGVYSGADPAKGAVLVIHENRGLTPHIRSIPPRLAADGYSALAIDLLSEEGGTASLDEGAAQAALGAAPPERLVADMRAGLDELERRAPGAPLAVIGFCFGGAMTWLLLAEGDPRIAAAVPFYGPLPEGADFSGSPSAAVLGIYAGLDDRVNASQDAARAALESAGLDHELRTFDGVDHAFFNDTGRNYDADAAAAAYDAMLDWFESHLASDQPGSTSVATS